MAGLVMLWWKLQKWYCLCHLAQYQHCGALVPCAVLFHGPPDEVAGSSCGWQSHCGCLWCVQCCLFCQSIHWMWCCPWPSYLCQCPTAYVVGAWTMMSKRTTTTYIDSFSCSTQLDVITVDVVLIHQCDCPFL